MKLQILSTALALCLCTSSLPTAHAWQEIPLQQKEVLTESPISELVTCDSTIPAPQEAYEAMIALKSQKKYEQGATWTDYEPYSDTKGYYHWKGGPLDGKNISAVGCVAFAFTLSDAAFGSLPARMYAEKKFTFEEIKVGDILRVNNDTHTVIVLEVSDAGVIVAEGNLSGKVSWGRAISKAEVMNNASHYITRYPENYVPPTDPEANVTIAEGTLSTGLPWKLTKAGTLTISGRGAMPSDFSGSADQPWAEHSGRVRRVVIEEGVTSIGSCAFMNCGVLSAEIPSSVTAIGSSAFRGSSIISVTIPSGVKSIGDSAFRECKNLGSVTVSEGLETIEQNAFRACTGLTSITLPSTIGEVGAAAFFECSNMKTAAFVPGSKQVKMGDNMFTRCNYLMSVTLPQNIDRISKEMFLSCLMLPGVNIPKGAESIEESAFASCSRLTTVIIPDSVTTMGRAAFASSSLKDIYFTGTEAQWDRISKISDTAAAVSKAVIHYNYTPDVSPEPEETPKPTETPAETPEPAPTEKPAETPEPAPTEKPAETPEPAPTEKPAETPEPAPTEKPAETPEPAPTEQGTWITEEDGEAYWYENGVKQGTEGRGKEIYDSKTDAWYWLDAEQNGRVAKDKDVFMETEDGAGKWVRYDENGKMIKGEDFRYGGCYYFDKVTGAMTKGWHTSEDGSLYYYDLYDGKRVSGECEIDGVPCYFEADTGKAADCVWHQTGEEQFWYENGVRQGLEGRGKEIYDPVSDAWYWLDSDSSGRKAVSKDVYMESYSAYPDRDDGTGKWVRYDENGHMVKGWNTTAAGTYYFEEITGAMAKGHVTIEGMEYYFDIKTGILQE